MPEDLEIDRTPPPADWGRPWTMYEQQNDDRYTRTARSVLAKLWDTDRYTGTFIGARLTVEAVAEVIKAEFDQKK
jgi:hypothetical protein